MKAKSITKRVLSAVLCAVMLFSCWVFTAPSASAAYTGVSAGTYNVKITCESGKATGGWNSDHHWTFYGKGTNGTASEASLGTLDQEVNYKSTKTVYENTSCSSFPSKITYKYSFGGGIGTWREVKITLHVYVNGIEVLSEYKSDSSSPLSPARGTFTWTVDSSKYPKASTMSGLSVTGGTVSADDNTFAVSGPTAVKDQYGVVIASAKTSESFSVANYKATNSSGANLTQDIAVSSTAVSKKDDNGFKAQGYQNHYLQIKCTSSFNGGTATGYADCTLTYKALTATWKYYTNNSNGASGTENTATSTVYFGDTPAARTDLTKAYYDNAKHHSGGTFSTSRMTADTPFTMSYSSNVDHTMNQYSQIANDKTNHTVKCSGCAYQKTEAHGSNYSGFTDDGDGNCSRTCSKCKFVQTEAHDWGDWKSIPETDTANAFAGHDRMAQHYRVCKNCQTAKDYDNHKWVAGEAVAPTCTDDGYTPYTCSDCKQETKNLNGEHVDRLGHDFQYNPSGTKTDTQHQEKCSRCTATQMVDHPSYGDWYEIDGTQHAHKCTVCQHEVKENHPESKWSGWQHAVPPADATGVRAIVREKLTAASYDATKQCFNYCNDCGYVKYQKHDWDDGVTTPAKCEVEGKTVYTCKDCENTKEEIIDALGHNYVQDSVDPVDGGEDISTEKSVKAYEYFYCDRCNKSYCPAIYDETSGEYVKDTENAKSTLAEIEENVEEIPTPLFNDHKETYTSGTKTGQYYYDERSSSFKLMTGEDKAYTGPNTKQDFRFSGSVQIPVDISYKIGTEEDNVITDFGYVYSRDDYIDSKPSRLVLNSGDAKIASLSVVGNKKTTNPVTQEAQNGGRLVGAGGAWSGVSYFHNGGDDTYELTFNLVISILAKNWKMQYAARPYVKYLYHGVEYTVYDGGATGVGYEIYSHSAVYSNVVYGLTAGGESQAVLDYCKERIIPHHNDFYPATITTKTDANTDWWEKFDTWEGTGLTWEAFSKSDFGVAYNELIAPYPAQS